MNIRALSVLAVILTFTIGSVGVFSVRSEPLVSEEQTIVWNSPNQEDILVLGSATYLGATSSSGLPVTFRVLNGPAATVELSSLASGGRFPYVAATNRGAVTVVAEQVGGIIDGKSYLATSVERTFNRTHVAEQLFSSNGRYWKSSANTPWGEQLPRECEVKKIYIESNKAYIALGRGGLWVLQVSDLSVNSAPRRVWQFGQPVKDVVVVGSIAYAAVGDLGLAILDVTKLDEPKLLGQIELGGDAAKLELVGNVAYVAVADIGVQIIDVRNPLAPFINGTITNSGPIINVQISGNLVCTATGKFSAGGDSGGELQIYNVSDSFVPTHLSSLPTKSPVTALRVDGNRAYVADSVDGIQVINISNPASPVVIGRRKIPTCYDISLEGENAYLACGDGGLLVLGLKDPANLQLYHRLKLVEPSLPPGAILNSSLRSVTAFGNLLFIGGETTLHVVRLSQGRIQQLSIDLPSSVDLGTSVLALNAFASSELPVNVIVKTGPAVIDGRQLLLKGTGSVVLEFSQPGDANYLPILEERTLHVITSKQLQTLSWIGPSPEAKLHPGRPYLVQALSSSGLPVTFRVENGPAYLSNGSLFITGAGSISLIAEQAGDSQYLPTQSVRVLAGSNLMFEPGHPVSRLGDALKISTQGTLAFLVCDRADVKIVSILDPSNPRIVSSISNIGLTEFGESFAVDLKVVGYLAYVVFSGAGGGGLAVVDIANPEHPLIIGKYYRRNLSPIGIHIQGTLAYLAEKSGTLECIDVSVPEQMMRKGGLLRNVNWELIQGLNSHLYLAGENNQQISLYVFDISVPETPRYISATPIGLARASGMYISGSKIFISGIFTLNGDSKVVQIDITDPREPIPRYEPVVAFDMFTSPIGGLQVKGNLMYVASRKGVTVVDLSEPPNGRHVQFQTVGTPFDVNVVNDFIHVADGKGGLQILSPNAPVLINPRMADANRISFRIGGNIRSKVLIESSSDLQNWGEEVYQSVLESSEITVDSVGDGRYFRAVKGPHGFVWIKTGSFMMGSPQSESERVGDELLRQVTLTRGFWMSEHEVTQSEYSAVKNNAIQGNELPAFVTWDEALMYCNELTKLHRLNGRITKQQIYRLPTEAEWEYAARAGTTGPRYSETNGLGISWKLVRPEVRRVMQYTENHWGLYDMLGNASEWCSDWYSEYAAGPQTDPIGPQSGSYRVIRGTGHSGAVEPDAPTTLRSAERWRGLPNTVGVEWPTLSGFRVVMSAVRQN